MRATILATLLTIAIGMIGCESFRAPLARMMNGPGATIAEAEERRDAFRSDGDPDAIRWLLANEVSNGMPLTDVETTLGLAGEPVHDASWKSSGGTRFQVTDTVYKWGPDAEGRAYYLVFRDDLLVNYDRREYR